MQQRGEETEGSGQEIYTCLCSCESGPFRRLAYCSRQYGGSNPRRPTLTAPNSPRQPRLPRHRLPLWILINGEVIGLEELGRVRSSRVPPPLDGPAFKVGGAGGVFATLKGWQWRDICFQSIASLLNCMFGISFPFFLEWQDTVLCLSHWPSSSRTRYTNRIFSSCVYEWPGVFKEAGEDSFNQKIVLGLVDEPRITTDKTTAMLHPRSLPRMSTSLQKLHFVASCYLIITVTMNLLAER